MVYICQIYVFSSVLKLPIVRLLMASRQLVVKDICRAADVIRNARALIITAGAGMGVDSGLPDFRGPEGFWRAYPPLKDKGIVLEGMSTPHWFQTDPKFAWGFFGHRYNLYKKTIPHDGFTLLQKWCQGMDKGYFVFTSNVDGHFQKAGFSEDRVVECHGSINYMQCCDPENCDQIWPVPEELTFDVDNEKLQLKSALPQGPPGENNCLARPNILMFGDWTWIDTRTKEQEERFFSYQMSLMLQKGIPFAVIEIGAGEYVPTVRYQSESLVSKHNKGTLIRINPRDWKVPDGNISLPIKGLEALKLIDSELQKG